MLGSLLVGLATGEAAALARRARSAAIAYLLVAVLAVIGLVFLLVAAFIVAARYLGPVPAALWFGGIFLALAFIILIVHRLAANSRKRELERQRTRELSAVATTTAFAAIPALSKSRGGLGALGLGMAMLGGYALYRLVREKGQDDPARPRRRRR